MTICSADPADRNNIFSWRICRSTDARGNTIVYEYDAHGLMQTIRYGNCRTDSGREEYCFSVVFTYAEGGKDVFTHHTRGFAHRVDRLCTKISMVRHHEGRTETVRETAISYDDSSGVSHLTAITVTGSRRDKDGSTTRLAAPPLSFAYSAWTPENAVFRPIRLADGASLYLGEKGFSPVDLHGEGIAGLLHADARSAALPQRQGRI